MWLPRDGRTHPLDPTLALAKGARQGGVTILENAEVTAIRTRGGAVAAVGTSRGDIACEVVVNCAGMWARALGAMAGVAIPPHAPEHFYIVTEPMAGVAPALPVLRDPDGHIYVREEVGGLLMGGFEPVAKPWGMDGIPADFSFSLLPEDWDHFQVMMEQAILRIPALETAPVRRHVNGPESFTPDGRYYLGEAPECRNFFVAAGFNSVGIASGAGAIDGSSGVAARCRQRSDDGDHGRRRRRARRVASRPRAHQRAGVRSEPDRRRRRARGSRDRVQGRDPRGVDRRRAVHRRRRADRRCSHPRPSRRRT